MKRLSDEEILEIALEPDIELEFERVMAMTDEEVRESLKARGHDLRVLEAEAEMFYRRFKHKKKLPRAYVAGGVALLTSAASLAAAALGPFASAAAPVVLATAASPAPGSPAADLRKQAQEACQREDWRTCLERLDQARDIDPGGDQEAAVVELRRRATEHPL